MRLFAKTQRLLIISMLTVCLAPVAGIAADLPGTIGEVVSMMGTATATQPDGAMRTLDLDAPVMTKDVISSGGKSNVEISSKDESMLSQGPNTSTSLDDFVYSETVSASKMLLKVGTGTLRYVTGEVVTTYGLNNQKLATRQLSCPEPSLNNNFELMCRISLGTCPSTSPPQFSTTPRNVQMACQGMLAPAGLVHHPPGPHGCHIPAWHLWIL
jgi:hypothetical protein